VQEGGPVETSALPFGFVLGGFLDFVDPHFGSRSFALKALGVLRLVCGYDLGAPIARGAEDSVKADQRMSRGRDEYTRSRLSGARAQ
jgi:hypothetical protein